MSIRPLSPQLKEKAKNELNEVDGKEEDYLRDIEEWLVKQPHLKVKAEKQRLLSFLRGCKFSLQGTKQKLDTFYTMRTVAPEFYKNRDPFLPEIQEILKRGIFVPITGSELEGFPTIILMKWENTDSEKVLYVNLFKTFLMLMDILLNENDNFVISGYYFIHDLNAIPVGYSTQVTPSLCKKVVVLQTTYPLRMKGTVCINAISAVEVFVNMFKPFLNEKLRNRIQVYGEKSVDSCYQIVPRHLLPKEYGGKGDSSVDIAAKWKKKVESYAKWFEEDSQYCSDETKRSGQSKISTDLFGMEGSFRKLDID